MGSMPVSELGSVRAESAQEKKKKKKKKKKEEKEIF